MGPPAPETGPLDGIKVVELAAVIAGPSAAALLAEWGAEVIKVEPREGDPFRGNSLPALFAQDNRDKRSLALDLTTARGREIVDCLLADADVFVSNLRPSALTRLGLDPTTVQDRNQGLVYGHIGGYAAEGPFADRPGYDVGAFWSRAGVAASLVGDAEPPVPRPGMGDHVTALALVAGIAAALVERQRTGRGRLVRTSLLRAGTFVISSDLAAHLAGTPLPAGLRRAMMNPLLGCFRAGDGRWFWLLGLQPERHWPGVARAIGRPELATDERFATFSAIIGNASTVIEVLDAAFTQRDLAGWADVFAAEDVWWDPVQSLDELLDDPVLADSGVLRPAADGGEVVAAPVDLGGSPRPAGRAPETGEHTEEILLEQGIDWPEIAALKDAGIIP